MVRTAAELSRPWTREFDDAREEPMSNWSRRAGILIGAWLFLVFVPGIVASAGTVFYTDRAAFEAAAVDLATITFENIAPSNGFKDVSTGLTLHGVTFNAPLLYVVDAAYTPDFYDWGSGAVLSGQSPLGGPVTITVALPAGITEVGADIMTFTPYADPVTFTLASGATITAPTDDFPSRAFVGVISTDFITSVSFSAPTNLNLDNFSFGPAPIPEPSTIVLLGIGIGGMLLVAPAKAGKSKRKHSKRCVVQGRRA
jgi:PEP-CTERM motif